MSPQEGPSSNNNESAAEHIHSREEIVSVLGQWCEQPKIVKERPDANGIYLLEVIAEEVTEGRGDYTLYVYQRKGIFSPQNRGSATVVEALYFKNGQLSSGAIVAELDTQTGSWVKK